MIRVFVFIVSFLSLSIFLFYIYLSISISTYLSISILACIAKLIRPREECTCGVRGRRRDATLSLFFFRKYSPALAALGARTTDGPIPRYHICCVANKPFCTGHPLVKIYFKTHSCHSDERTVTSAASLFDGGVFINKKKNKKQKNSGT